VSAGLTAYVIVDNTNAVDGGEEAGRVVAVEPGWAFEVVVLVVPLVERVMGATTVLGALLGGLVAVVAVLRAEESVAARAVPTVRATIPAISRPASTLGFTLSVTR
jgi:hypothetical protein